MEMVKRIFPAVCLLVFVAQQCPAGTAAVSNSGDTGAGSLRQAIIDSNAAGGVNTIQWQPSGGESIILESNYDSVNTNTTLDVTNSTSPVSISGSYAMPLGGAVTFRNDNISSTWTIAAILGGSGSLTKTGGGKLTLTGENTYGGGTFIYDGTLNVNSDAALGNSVSTITFDGGILQNAASFSSARPVTLDSLGGTFDTNSYNLSLSGIIDGTGSLTKKGDGTLTLSGASTYSGGTTINSGTLALGANNALPAAGTLGVSSGGAFDMGGFTQTLGAFASSGTLKMQLQPGVTNLTVAGNAALDGTLSVNFAPQVFTAGQTFTPLAAGTVSGTFSSIVSPAALLFTPTYSATSLLLTVSLVPFYDIAATGNQRAVGAGLEPFRVAPTGDMSTVLGNMYTLDAAQLQAAFDQIGPSSFGSMRQMGVAASGMQSAVLSRRAMVLSDGAGHTGLAAMDMNEQSMRYTPSATAAKSAPPEKRETQSGSPLGFFAAGVGATARINDSSEISGYTLYDGGLLAGADYQLGGHAAVGVLLGYLHGQASDFSLQTGKVTDDSARYGAYAAGYADNFHITAYAGRAEDYYSTSRGVAFGNISRTATAKPRGSEINLYTGASCDFKWAGGRLSPLAELNYDKFEINPFAETGADSLNLNVGSQTAESMRSNLGARFSAQRGMGAYTLASYISASWRHEFKTQSLIDARFAAGGGEFSVSAGDFGRNGLLAALGVSANWDNRTIFTFDYSGDFNTTLTKHGVNAGLHFKF